MQGIDIFGELGTQFAGAASEAADTFEGKMKRLKVGLDEAKESLGEVLLPTVERFIGFLNDTGIPTLNAFIAGLTGDKGLSASLNETQRSAESFGKGISVVAGIISGFITFVREAIGLVVSLANELIRVVNIIPGVNIGSIPNPAPSAAGVPQLPQSPNARESRSSGSTVNNITVQALDSESAARAVAKVINESAARSIPALSGRSVRGD